MMQADTELTQNSVEQTTGLVTLVPGGTAQPFEATCLNGEQLSLARLEGQRTWLTFFHFLECPVCLLRANEMIRRYPHWAAPDFQMVGVFHAGPDEVRQSLGERDIPFPVICDPGKELYCAYGLRRATRSAMNNFRYKLKAIGAMFRGYRPARSTRNATVLPGDFLINETGKLHDVYYGRYMGDHISFGSVERWLGFKLN